MELEWDQARVHLGASPRLSPECVCHSIASWLASGLLSVEVGQDLLLRLVLPRKVDDAMRDLLDFDVLIRLYDLFACAVLLDSFRKVRSLAYNFPLL